MRGYINRPLKLAIKNESGRTNLAIDRLYRNFDGLLPHLPQ
jgi:hypothetical protein